MPWRITDNTVNQKVSRPFHIVLCPTDLRRSSRPSIFHSERLASRQRELILLSSDFARKSSNMNDEPNHSTPIVQSFGKPRKKTLCRRGGVCRATTVYQKPINNEENSFGLQGLHGKQGVMENKSETRNLYELDSFAFF